MSKSLTPWALTLAMTAAMAAILLWMGRVPICTCGTVKLWHGVVVSSENSQHLSDWYTPSHILHGLVFYGVLHLIARRVGIGWRALVATIVEAAWEVAENTNAVIERYREVTISLDYYGDSVVNSVADVVAMWVGFALARVLPVWASVALFFAFEIGVGYVIRDGLTLNVIQLLAPQEWITDWQSGR